MFKPSFRLETLVRPQESRSGGRLAGSTTLTSLHGIATLKFVCSAPKLIPASHFRSGDRPAHRSPAPGPQTARDAGEHAGRFGATDDLGFVAVEDKIHVNHLHACMLALLGLDHLRLTYSFQGLERRLSGVGEGSERGPDMARRLTGGSMLYRREQASLSALFLLVLSPVWAESPKPESVPPFTGKVHLPLSLETSEGSRLEKGPFDLEVRAENGAYTLHFFSAGGEKAVTAEQPDQGPQEESGYPLVGTIHLRSISDPVGTDVERHHSKTGLPQYQEESRRWDATLRMYRLEGQDKVISVLFHQNQQLGSIQARFRLFATDASDGP